MPSAELDPLWESGIQVGDKVVKELCNPQYKDKIERIPHYKLIKGKTFPNGTITQDKEIVEYYEENIIGKEQIGCKKTGKVDVSGKIYNQSGYFWKVIGNEVCGASNIDGGEHANWYRMYIDTSVDIQCDNLIIDKITIYDPTKKSVLI